MNDELSERLKGIAFTHCEVTVKLKRKSKLKPLLNMQKENKIKESLVFRG